MGIISDAFTEVFRDFLTDGVASSGKYEPIKSELRALGQMIDDKIAEVILGVSRYATVADLPAVTVDDAGISARVTLDPTPANNTYWVVDATGTWVIDANFVANTKGTDGADGIDGLLAAATIAEVEAQSDDTKAITPRATDQLYGPLRAVPVPSTSRWLVPFLNSLEEVVGGFERETGRFVAEFSPDCIFPASFLDVLSEQLVLTPDELGNLGGDSFSDLAPEEDISAATGFAWTNHGRGGSFAEEVAAYIGAVPAQNTADFTVPADTSSVAVSLDVDALFIASSFNTSRTGVFGGIPGTLTRTTTDGTRATASYTFARTTAGTATLIEAGSEFVPVAYEQLRNQEWIFCFGKNNANSQTYDEAIRNVAKAYTGLVKMQQRRAARIMFRSIIPNPASVVGDDDHKVVLAINKIGELIAGNQFVNTYEYLLQNYEEAAAWTGPTGTEYSPVALSAADYARLDAGLIPASFMGLGVHLSTQIYSFELELVSRRRRAMGVFGDY